MNSYYLPDPTGVNPDYRQVNIPFNIYQAGIKIGFDNSPVFVSSIRIALTDGSSNLLVKDVDWKVNPDDVDEQAMSRAFLENPQFTGILAKSVTIISTTAINKIVALSYQEFYLTNPNRFFDDGRPFEITPDLIKSLVTGLADCRQQLAKVSSPVAPVLHSPVLLPFDVNAELTSNLIPNESVLVNTIAGAKVIRLTQGAYFADSLIITYAGAPLSKETDYLPIGLSPLTEQSLSKGGIYQYILLNNQIAGELLVTYHAVGGEVQLSDINAVYEQQQAIKQFLDNELFITADTVVETPAFRALNARLNGVENNVRSLLSGSPTYGDANNNDSVLRPVAASDAGFHWWTIASLYQVQGSPDIITADQFKGRVFFPGAKVAVAFTADVNLQQPRQIMSFKTDTLVMDPTYTLFKDVSVQPPVYPLIRLVYNQSSQAFSGACLQIGLPLVSLSDQMVVEDFSSTESCWILNREGQFVTGNQTVSPSAPKDNGFLLPDGNSLWAQASSISYSVVAAPQYDTGYLIYSGSNVTLNQLTTTTSTSTLFNVVLPSYFPVENSTAILVACSSADNSIQYDIEIPTPFLQAGVKAGRLSFIDSENELLTMTVSLSRDTSNNIVLSLHIIQAPFTATSTPISPLTDVIRYVRAKV